MLDNLPKITYAYNHYIHRGIRTQPDNVNKENAIAIWKRLYGQDKR